MLANNSNSFYFIYFTFQFMLLSLHGKFVAITALFFCSL